MQFRLKWAKKAEEDWKKAYDGAPGGITAENDSISSATTKQMMLDEVRTLLNLNFGNWCNLGESRQDDHHRIYFSETTNFVYQFIISMEELCVTIYHFHNPNP